MIPCVQVLSDSQVRRLGPLDLKKRSQVCSLVTIRPCHQFVMGDRRGTSALSLTRTSGEAWDRTHDSFFTAHLAYPLCHRGLCYPAMRTRSSSCLFLKTPVC